MKQSRLRKSKNLPWMVVYAAACAALGMIAAMAGEPITVVDIPVESVCNGNNRPVDALTIESRLDNSGETPKVTFETKNQENRTRGLSHELLVVNPQGEDTGVRAAGSPYTLASGKQGSSHELHFDVPAEDGYYVVLVRSAASDFDAMRGVQEDRLFVYVDNGVLVEVTQDEFDNNSTANQARIL